MMKYRRVTSIHNAQTNIYGGGGMTGCVTYLCTGVALCSVMYICVYCILGILFQQSLVSSQMKIDKIFLGLWNLLSGCVWSPPPSTLYSGRSLLKPIPGSRFLSRTHMYLNFENCTFRLQISFYSLKYLTMIVLNFDNIQSLRQYKVCLSPIRMFLSIS